ncbi:MAG: hypothetical protein NXI16_13910 [Alphaproteobacteria bacterium]|nr:hypothetical protein [Alphaproteobacteria bacterium]
MTFPALALLFVAQAAVVLYAARHAGRAGEAGPIAVRVVSYILLALALWGGVSGFLAATGVYQREAFLTAWPSLWITMVPVVLVMAPTALSATVRRTVFAVVAATPDHWLIAVQVLRIAAVGSIVKALDGDLVFYFPMLIGIPDLVFGLSAIPLALAAARRRLPDWVLLAWHLVGAAIILPAGVVLMQLGLPGPLQVFTDTPTVASVFAFPMALAPTLIVPLFVLFNLMAATAVLSRRALPAKAARIA